MLLPSSVRPRLNGRVLRVVHPEDIIDEIPLTDALPLVHATNLPVSEVLAAPTRNIKIDGLNLQKAHRRVGYHLALELLPKLTGLEKYEMTSVQEKLTSGHRIRNAGKTIVISCMPLAQGVFKALPAATYVHAQDFTDLQNKKHVKAIREAKLILLCDFVINNGETMIDFIKKIRSELNQTARIVMMAGVVQAGSVREDRGLTAALKDAGSVGLVALRLSENKYTGKGTTDTGSRLFNTTKAEQ